MRFRRKRPARCASTTRSCSSCTLNRPLGNFSRTVPVTSMLSSLLINLSKVDLGGTARCAETQKAHRPATGGLSSSHVGRLQSLRPTRHFELDPRTLLEAAVALRLDRREVHENVFSILPLDEAISLGCIKPLHCTFFFHSISSVSTTFRLETGSQTTKGLRFDSASLLVLESKYESNAPSLYHSEPMLES